MSTDLRDLVRYHLPNFPLQRVRRLYTDTTEFSSIGYGDVIRLGDKHYMVLRDEAERRFGLEDFKFWVKRCKCLETGEGVILKLVFHEEFTQQIGPLTVRSFRSERKEARILDLVRDDPRFMHGFSLEDEVGNLVRVLEIIRGRRLDVAIDNLPGNHLEYFEDNLRSTMEMFITGCEAIDFLHKNNERHGDVRRDHLWVESTTGQARWIDFDYAYEATANPFALDLFGLGNALLFVVGKQIYTPGQFDGMEGVENIVPDDFSLIFKNRLVNLRRIFPYIPKPLNNVLMHFAAGAEVFYESVEEFLDDLRPCLDYLPKQ
ncbi:serine/threonine protein kinase [Pseudodesulfovibrio sp. zrk46]|uniref:serine/threonine protein kinase n=1 Tax=Pseudodesulfovibrio sp. zrk46 TaxID=2725288 RepID=UPI001449A39B|nr:serine/threonine protein kinase [Pseudodesulfovibrio sp. zrk46]QJB55224.1 serine/threonine protein kinase [Pseudodesulfovibrio sp. zrk46]